MSILTAILGVGERLVGKLFGSRQERDRQSHDQTMAGNRLDTATLGQFATEFAAADRSLWGSFVNGLNRLPRPIVALGIFWIVFAWPAVDMEGFQAYCEAVATVPSGFWLLAGTVVTFYFGGRMQIKAAQFRQTEDQVRQAAALVARQNPWEDPDTGRPFGT